MAETSSMLVKIARPYVEMPKSPIANGSLLFHLKQWCVSSIIGIDRVCPSTVSEDFVD